MTTRIRTTKRYWTLREINRAVITKPALNEIFEATSSAVNKVIPYDRSGLIFMHPSSAL
jgi:hypothetical protein